MVVLISPQSMSSAISPEARLRSEQAWENYDKEPGYYYTTALEKHNLTRDDDRYLRAFEYAMMWLLDNRPFYAHIFYDVVRRRTHTVKTLCVLIKDARIELWYNPDFLALHSLRHNVGFLQHEAGHLIAGHLAEKKRMFDQGQSLPPYHDLAVDLSVDTLIQAKGDQPDWVILPKDLRVPDAGRDPSQWARAEEQRRWTYYEEVLEAGDPWAQLAAKIRIRPLADGLTIDGVLSNSSVPDPGIGGEGGGGHADIHLLTSFDDHDHWDKGDPPDVQEQVVSSTVKKAFSRSGSTMRGYVHGQLMEMVEARLKEKSVPFERVVRAFVGGHIKVGHKATPMRLSRRRHIPPGHTFTKGLDILVGGDDSGSVVSEEVALFRSELHHLNQVSGVRVRFQRFCCGLVGDLLDLDVVDFSAVLQRANGGTDFNAIIEQAHELRPDLLMIMTDGQAPTPNRKPPCPMAWILTHDGTSHPWGTIIRLPTIEDIRRGYRAVIERWAPR